MPASFSAGEFMTDDFENYGVPCFYITGAIAEPAGGGNVRIWNVCTRNGKTVPICEIIIPAANLVMAAKVVTEAAVSVFNEAQMVIGMMN
jgi:hypothetical protein